MLYQFQRYVIKSYTLRNEVGREISDYKNMTIIKIKKSCKKWIKNIYCSPVRILKTDKD